MKSILISACLLGMPCRYDGKCKKSIDLTGLRNKYSFVPVCPEIYGGLPTPRTPSERVGESVIMADGTNVTENFVRGAEAAYELALQFDCRVAVLKERSPSCGCGEIYDGSFTKAMKAGDGVTAEYLKAKGIEILGESRISELDKIVDKMYFEE